MLRRLRKRLGTRDGICMYASIKTNRFNNIQLTTLQHPFTLSDKNDLMVFCEIFVEKHYRIPHTIIPTRIGYFEVPMKFEVVRKSPLEGLRATMVE